MWRGSLPDSVGLDFLLFSPVPLSALIPPSDAPSQAFLNDLEWSDVRFTPCRNGKGQGAWTISDKIFYLHDHVRYIHPVFHLSDRMSRIVPVLRPRRWHLTRITK